MSVTSTRTEPSSSVNRSPDVPLRFVPIRHVHVFDGGVVEVLGMADDYHSRILAHAFAVVLTGSTKQTPQWGVYDRAEWLKRMGRLRRRQGPLDEARVTRTLRLHKPATIVESVVQVPTEPAVVVRGGRPIGVWVRELARSPHVKEMRGDELRGVEAEVLRRAPILLDEESFRYYVGVDADVMEPLDAELLDSHEVSAQVASTRRPTSRPVRLADETLRRTPHIDVEDHPAIEPGMAFIVEVYTDEANPRSFERSEDVVVAAPASQASFELAVSISASEHFVVEDDLVKVLTIERSKPKSACVPFTMRASIDQSAVQGTPTVAATFTYKRRPAGMVTREVALTLPTTEAVAPQSSVATAAALEVQTLAIEPDLVVVVSRPSGLQPFSCEVSSGVLEDFRSPVREEWGFRHGAEEQINKRLGLFTSKSSEPEERLADLRGAGLTLYQDAPANFRTAVEQLLALENQPRSLLIATQEPAMPWELLIPPDGLGPLGVRLRMGRWTDPDLRSPRQDIRVEEAYVFAPKYASEKRALVHAQDEAAFVCENLSGRQIEPVTFGKLKAELREHVPALMHFVCHGSGETGFSQAIYIDGDKELSAERFRGMGLEAAWRRAQPLVFLNACEVGRQTPGLIGAGGFANVFVAMGARGVIAPLWKVRDGLAYEVALALYKELLENPRLPIADALREIRRRTYEEAEHEDTFAAYCWYGDPQATMQV